MNSQRSDSPARLTFHGAAETVTGSKYLLEAAGARVMIDCGLFQGAKRLRLMNWDKPQFDAARLDAIVLTHAHLDHTGYLPRMGRHGYSGPVYGTDATEELTRLILFDSAKNQQRDAEYANRKGFSKHKPALPLYNGRDVERVMRQFRRRRRGEWFSPAEPIWMRYHDAGHLLGSNLIETEIRSADPPLRIVFSGDVGRYNAPLYHDPAPPPPCDYLICESTYGNRDHGNGDVLDELEEVVHASIRRGGVIVVSSFAVGRVQQLIYLLQVLIHDGRIPRLPVFLDSPMAVNATHIYYSHREDHDLAEGELTGRHSVLKGPNVHLASRVEQSKRLNHVSGPAVIISSSGMMTGGRILHHLRQRLPDANNTILLGGFMAYGTRGRALAEGAHFLRMHGRDVPVKAHVESISGLSGHAGRSELLRWLEPLPAPQEVFLTHGELDSAADLAETLRTGRGWRCTVPKLGQSFVLGQREVMNGR